MLNVALPLGLWFVAEYYFLVISTSSIFLAALRTPLMLVMPVALCYLLYKIRNKFFYNDDFGRFRCWYYGTQIMFYAGLIEAFGIAVYNHWIDPNNLTDMHNAMVAQYENVLSTYNSTPGAQQLAPGLMKTFEETVQLLREAEIETPFSAAINMLSNDIFYGAIWSLIFCFFLRRKNPEAAKTENTDNTDQKD